MDKKEKMRQLIKRTEISEKEAVYYLEKSDFDLLEAIIEAEKEKYAREKVLSRGTEIVNEIRRISKQLKGKRILVRKEGENIIDVKIESEKKGLFLFPLVSLAGVILHGSEIFLINEKKEEINITDKLTEYIDRIVI